VGGVQLRPVVAVAPGQVEDEIDAGCGPPQAVHVGDVAPGDVDALGHGPGAGVGPDERPHCVPCADGRVDGLLVGRQRGHEVAADETGRAGDEDHAVVTGIRFRCGAFTMPAAMRAAAAGSASRLV
jgi:hypothetical protein